jgi:hypothetical protein
LASPTSLLILVAADGGAKIRPVETRERIVVGSPVPREVELEAVPTEWGPSLTKYRYVYSGEHVMLVESRDTHRHSRSGIRPPRRAVEEAARRRARDEYVPRRQHEPL